MAKNVTNVNKGKPYFVNTFYPLKEWEEKKNITASARSCWRGPWTTPSFPTDETFWKKRGRLRRERDGKNCPCRTLKIWVLNESSAWSTNLICPRDKDCGVTLQNMPSFSPNTKCVITGPQRIAPWVFAGGAATRQRWSGARTCRGTLSQGGHAPTARGRTAWSRSWSGSACPRNKWWIGRIYVTFKNISKESIIDKKKSKGALSEENGPWLMLLSCHALGYTVY